MYIVSYNVNGIRAAIKNGLIQWIKIENPDIICFQETKAHLQDIPVTELESLGYKSYWYSAEKKGYSGVGILSKIEPNTIAYGVQHPLYDSEGRTLIATFDKFTLINTYFPSGSSGEERQSIKMEFLDYYYQFIQQILKQSPKLIVVGDYNIAHTEIDIHDPKGNKNSSGFLPEERSWMDKWVSNGMHDSFRMKNGAITDLYSWWTYRAGARPKNKGWRIDYISVSDELQDFVTKASIHNEAVHSDHCPVSIHLQF